MLELVVHACPDDAQWAKYWQPFRSFCAAESLFGEWKCLLADLDLTCTILFIVACWYCPCLSFPVIWLPILVLLLLLLLRWYGVFTAVVLDMWNYLCFFWSLRRGGGGGAGAGGRRKRARESSEEDIAEESDESVPETPPPATPEAAALDSQVSRIVWCLAV